jgi:hypothetical protein
MNYTAIITEPSGEQYEILLTSEQVEEAKKRAQEAAKK